MGWVKKLSQRMGKFRKSSIIALLGIGGMLLILFSQIGSDQKRTISHDTVETTVDMADYEARLEERLLSIIQKMDGVGHAELMITMESGVEHLYVKEEKTSTDKTEDTNGESNKVQNKETAETNVTVLDGAEALLRKELEPTVRGVVVICEGGDDIRVQQHVIDAVTAALNISSARVSVTKIAEYAVTE